MKISCSVTPAGLALGMGTLCYTTRVSLDGFVASSSMTESQVTSPNAELIGHLTLYRLEEIVRDAPSEVNIFGPTMAREALLAGLVVDYQFFVVPKVVGGGLRALTEGANLDLKLVERHEFSNGTVYLRYAKTNLT